MNESILKLSEELGKLLIKKELKMAIAESCTGGLLGAAITEIPGSSGYFKGGVITYSDQAKTEILGVSPDILNNPGLGAVSAETVIAMAAGVRELFHTDAAISVSGIAGPDGGAGDKPVGLVFIGISLHGAARSFKYQFESGLKRSEIREKSVETGLKRLIGELVVQP